jgi:anthranilate phosphoribosyltransferase
MPADAVQSAVRRLAFGGSLSAEESTDAFGMIMSGEATPAQVAALLWRCG